MDSSVGDTKVNPIGILRADRVTREGDEQVIKKKKKKKKRTVQWNDTHGNQLAEILEFLPSDVSDIGHEETESCFCNIM